MKFPWANVFILLLGGVELVTGFLGLVDGTPDWVSALHVHRIVGFSIVALLIWKGQNVLASLLNARRWRRAFVPYLASLLLLCLLLTALTLGLVWSHAGHFSFMGFSGVSWHIYISLAIIPFILWHMVFHRWSMRPRFWAERRSFLRVGGLVIAGLALWRIGELGNQILGFPGADRRFTGSYEMGSFSGNAFPTTSWLNDRPQPIDSDEWNLEVTGLVERELALPYDELAEYEERVTATLDCTGGWYSTQDWEGVPMKDILGKAEVGPGAGSVTVRSVTGYYRRFSLDEANRYILATRVGNETLSHSHGYPLRLVAPGKRGFEWVKWVVAIEVNDTSKWWQPPLPLQ